MFCPCYSRNTTLLSLLFKECTFVLFIQGMHLELVLSLLFKEYNQTGSDLAIQGIQFCLCYSRMHLGFVFAIQGMQPELVRLMS